MKNICGNCCFCDKQNSGLYFCSLEGMQHFLESPYERPCNYFDPWENPEFEKEN